MFQRTKQGAVSVITGASPLTGEQTTALQGTLLDCLEDGQPKAVLEMQGIPLLDSLALEMLLDVQDDFQRRAGVLKLAAPTPLCREILSLTGVAARFEIYPEAKSAVGSFVQ